MKKEKIGLILDFSGLKQALFFIFICLILFSTLFARVTVETIKTSSPPEIDGVLDEPVWKRAKGYSDFISFSPEWGKPIKEKTVVYSVYDADNLYFGFRCWDREPDKIVATIRKRDTSGEEDHVAVFIDSHNDGQNAYFFSVNPLGIQTDGILNTGGEADNSQDFVWESAGVKNDNGYTVEVKVPFKTLRFANAKIVKMRVGFSRKILRYSDQYAFPEWGPGNGSIVGQLGYFQLEGINCKRVFEVLPGFTFKKERVRGADDSLLSSEEKKLGLTAKIGITSDLMLDMTVNPDFSHIEIDEGQVDVNLRVDPDYDEKRPFFLEGLEHFAFAGSGSGTPIEKIVNTREIVEPVLGLKLSGKIGRSNIVNSLFALDESPLNIGASTSLFINDVSGNPGDNIEDRKGYFGILRFKHLIKNDSYIGTIYTGKELSGGYNHVGGLDSRIRLSGYMTLDAFFLYSFARYPAGAGRPAAETEGSAFGWKLNYENRYYYANLGYHDLSKDFELDIGRVMRKGIRVFSADVERYFFIPSGFLKRITLGYAGSLARDTNFDMNEYSHKFNIWFDFSSETRLILGYYLANEVYEGILFNKDGFFINAKSQVSKYLKLEFNYSSRNWPFYYELLQGDLDSLYFSVKFQPGKNFSTEFNITHQVFHEDAADRKRYDIGIYRNKTIFHVNKYLFLRGIVEYNSYYKRIACDSLVGFTYIPGTVIYLGYGPTFEERETDMGFMRNEGFRETRSALFFKASYLFRF